MRFYASFKRWALWVIFIFLKVYGGVIVACLSSSFLLLTTTYVRYISILMDIFHEEFDAISGDFEIG